MTPPELAVPGPVVGSGSGAKRRLSFVDSDQPSSSSPGAKRMRRLWREFSFYLEFLVYELYWYFLQHIALVLIFDHLIIEKKKMVWIQWLFHLFWSNSYRGVYIWRSLDDSFLGEIVNIKTLGGSMRESRKYESLV